MHASGFGDVNAAGFQIKHRFTFGITHLYFRARAGSKAHFQAARGVGRGEEAFRPWCVVAVGKDGFCTIDGDSFRVACVAQHAELKFGCFFQRALS